MTTSRSQKLLLLKNDDCEKQTMTKMFQTSFSASLSLLFFRPCCYWKLKMWSMILTHGVLVGCFCKVCWVHNYRFVLSLCFQTSNNCWACIKTGKFLFKCLWMNLPNEKSQKTTSDTITSTLEKKKIYIILHLIYTNHF